MLRNILVINQPLGNRGDESAHRALMRNLNRAFSDTKITVLFMAYKQEAIEEFEVVHPNNIYVNLTLPHNYMSTFVAKTAMRKGVIRTAVKLHPVLRKLKPYYQNADLVICAPGGICMGGFQDWMHLFYLEMAKIYHKPLAYYSRSFGPFPTQTSQNRYFKKKSMEMLRYFTFLSIRDKKTMALADELHVPYVPSIDTAFLEQPHVDLPQSLQGVQTPYIVFVPNKLTWHYAYKQCDQSQIDEFYLMIVSRLQTKFPTHKIVMLPQTSTIYEKGDYYYFLHLRDMCEHIQNIEVVPDIYGSDIQQTIIQSASLVIGARYHSIVFAINNARPFIALNYEHKIAGLLEILGLSEYKVNISDIFDNQQDMLRAIRQIDALLEVSQQQNLQSVQQNAREVAQHCFNIFMQQFS